MESRVTSDAQGKKTPGVGPSRGRAHTYDPRAGWASSGVVTEADGCQGRRNSPGKAGADFPNGENFLANMQVPERGWSHDSQYSDVPNSLSPTLEPDRPEGQNWGPLPGPWLRLHRSELEVTKGSESGFETEEFTNQTLALKHSLSEPRKLRQRSRVRLCGGPSPAVCPSASPEHSPHFIYKWGDIVCG